MNSQVAPIPEMCVHYLKEIKKGRTNSAQWFKAFKRRGVADELLAEPGDDAGLVSAIERIKKEYEIHA